MARKTKRGGEGGTTRWTAIPAQRSSAAALKVKVWTILGLLITCAVLGLLSSVAWLSSKAQGAASAPVATGNGATGGAFAAAAAEDFVAGRAYSVPVASDVGAPAGAGGLEGVQAVVWVNASTFTTADGRRYEIHTFALPGDPPRRVSVTVELTPTGPVLATAPTLQPVLVGDGDGLEPFGEVTLQASNALGRIVGEWASAYAGDSRQDLFDLTGDRKNRTYYGLGGMTAADASILALEQAQVAGYAAVRVTFTLTDGKFSMPVTYDLLAADWDTASPKIVAWGAAGTGPYLQPFQNAGTVATAGFSAQ